jgi:hypothetical protein
MMKEELFKETGYVIRRQKNVMLSPNRPIGFWDVKDPILSRQSAYRLSDCQPYAPAALYSPETSRLFCLCYLFLLEAEWIPGPSEAGIIRWIEKKFI